jgi:predicted GIY-YIG superfamily endonuclease
MKLHMNGYGARHTKLRRPTKLVYVEEFASRARAMKREKTRNVEQSSEEELIKCQINPKQKI